MVDPVSSEQFVRPLPGKHHFYLPAGQFRDKIKSYAGWVRQRLVHIILNRRQGLKKFISADDSGCMLQIFFRGCFLCPVDLIAAAVLRKPHCKSFLPGKIGRRPAGIHPAGQKAAHLHIADPVRLYGILKGSLDPVRRLGQRHGFIRAENRLPVSADMQRTVPVSHTVGGGQTENTAIKSLRRNRILKREIAFQGSFIQLPLKSRELQKALDL